MRQDTAIVIGERLLNGKVEALRTEAEIGAVLVRGIVVRKVSLQMKNPPSIPPFRQTRYTIRSLASICPSVWDFQPDGQ